LCDLKRIKAPVDPVHEFGAIAYPSLLKGRLFFENGKGHSTPFANVLSTGRKVAVALGIEVDKRMMIENFSLGSKIPPSQWWSRLDRERGDLQTGRSRNFHADMACADADLDDWNDI
jgi:3-polyprenyl-4-hydroxybenzoate decarboxylase